MTHQPLELNAILVPDKKIGGFTGYFAELPHAITEGRTEEEVIQNLKDLFFYVIKDQAKRMENAISNKDEYIEDGVICRPVNVFE